MSKIYPTLILLGCISFLRYTCSSNEVKSLNITLLNGTISVPLTKHLLSSMGNYDKNLFGFNNLESEPRKQPESTSQSSRKPSGLENSIINKVADYAYELKRILETDGNHNSKSGSKSLLKDGLKSTLQNNFADYILSHQVCNHDLNAHNSHIDFESNPRDLDIRQNGDHRFLRTLKNKAAVGNEFLRRLLLKELKCHPSDLLGSSDSVAAIEILSRMLENWSSQKDEKTSKITDDLQGDHSKMLPSLNNANILNGGMPSNNGDGGNGNKMPPEAKLIKCFKQKKGFMINDDADGGRYMVAVPLIDLLEFVLTNPDISEPSKPLSVVVFDKGETPPGEKTISPEDQTTTENPLKKGMLKLKKNKTQEITYSRFLKNQDEREPKNIPNSIPSISSIEFNSPLLHSRCGATFSVDEDKLEASTQSSDRNREEPPWTKKPACGLRHRKRGKSCYPNEESVLKEIKKRKSKDKSKLQINLTDIRESLRSRQEDKALSQKASNSSKPPWLVNEESANWPLNNYTIPISETQKGWYANSSSASKQTNYSNHEEINFLNPLDKLDWNQSGMSKTEEFTPLRDPYNNTNLVNAIDNKPKLTFSEKQVMKGHSGKLNGHSDVWDLIPEGDVNKAPIERLIRRLNKPPTNAQSPTNSIKEQGSGWNYAKKDTTFVSSDENSQVNFKPTFSRNLYKSASNANNTRKHNPLGMVYFK